MKLYYTPGACSQAPHIILHEAGLPHDSARVDLRAKKLDDGSDYLRINPKGYVPALELDDGQVLTEGPAIVQFLADRRPEAGLVPAAGTFERYRVVEMLGYLNSELHKTYSPLFNPNTSQEVRAERHEYLKKRYALIEQQLTGRDYLFGERFGVADAYLFTLTNWAKTVKLDLSDFPSLLAFQQRVAARPAVQAALKAEGLIK